jgi:hypothetical protein
MARKKTISIRELARKDRADVITLEMQAKAAELFERAGFTPVIRGTSTSRMSVHGKGSDHEWRINVEMYPHVNADRAAKSARRKRAIKINQHVNELWIIGTTISRELETDRHEFSPGVRVMTFEELEKFLDREHPLGKSPRLSRRDKSAARTRAGKALTVNADQLLTAIATSILLIEEKVEALSHERPNSDKAIAERDSSIEDLTRIRCHLEIIRKLPDQLNNGTVSETAASKSVKTFADGVKAFWNKRHETICARAYDAALFSSLVLVGSLAGSPGGWTLAVSAAMVGGKPVMDGLRGLSKKLFQG